MLINESNDSCIERIKNAQLTFKELEVLSLSKNGMSCQEISEELFVSIETIKSHRKNIIKKLHLYGKQEFRRFIIDLVAEELVLQHENSPQSHPKG
jgi:DNA-binding NarL/FixJ family response regulator